MKEFSCKKLFTALALSLSLALTVPSVLPVVSTVSTVEAATAPTLSQTSLNLRAGEVIKLKVSNKGKKKITWTVKNKKVAIVKNGVVTAAGKGKTVITAKVGNKKLKCSVVVTANSYTYDVPAATSYDSGYVYEIPSNVYFKNGKLYCKSALINTQFYNKIKAIVNKKGKNISKLDVVLTAYTYNPVTGTMTTTELAKGKVKNTLPKNISYNNSKMFTLEFSGSQIKQKGVDLTKIDYVVLDIKTDLYCTH